MLSPVSSVGPQAGPVVPHVLHCLGWSSCATDPQPNLDRLARVSRVDRGAVMVETVFGSRRGVLVGKLMLADEEDRPAVGDWIVWAPMSDEEVVVIDLLPRRSQLCRVSAGTTARTQVLAANVDLALIAMGLDGDYNLSRLERYLTMVRSGQVQPVVLLTKADLCPDVESRRLEVQSLVPDLPVHALCVPQGVGLDPVATLLKPGTTAVLLGSSGVGKSTLINHLLGEARQSTSAVRASDQRGRHTTTARTLLTTPHGGVIIDTPGLRELVPLAGELALELTFPEIHAFAEGCRFRDCSHRDEPGCAVQAAIEEGQLDPRRLGNYQKLQREAARALARTDERQAWMSRSRERSFGKMSREAQALKQKRNRG